MQDLVRGHTHDGQDCVITGYAQKAQSYHQQPGDRPPAERYLQCLVETAMGGLCGARIGPDRYVHADIAGCA